MGRIISKQDLIKIQKTNKFSEEEFSNLVINSTPSAWAETYLYDPDKKEKNLVLKIGNQNISFEFRQKKKKK